MANHQELREISKSRLRAARILIDNDDYDGAVYLMIYALECALKAVICKTLRLRDYPDKSGFDKRDNIFKTHNFDILLTLSGMEEDFSFGSASKKRYQNWSEATKYKVDVRYEPVGSRSLPEAKRIYKALVEKPNGVISWIVKHRRW